MNMSQWFIHESNWSGSWIQLFGLFHKIIVWLQKTWKVEHRPYGSILWGLFCHKVWPPLFIFTSKERWHNTWASLWTMSKPLIHDHSQTVQQVIFTSFVSLVSLPPLLPVFNYSPVWLVISLLQPWHTCKQSESLEALKYAWLPVTGR